MSTTAESIKLRAEVPLSDQWNLAPLYPNDASWEEEFKKSYQQSFSPYWPDLQSYRGRIKEGAEILKQLLDKTFALARRLEKLYTYAHLKHDEEITIDLYKASFQRISMLLFDFQQECAWIEPEILSLNDETIKEYLQSPLLDEYRVHLEKILRMRPHTLTADKEELLAMAGKSMQTSPKAFAALNNADIKFDRVLDSTGKEYELTHGLYQLYLRSPDRILRENAFRQMHQQYLGFENTLAELLYGEIQSHIFNAQARQFPSSLEAALFPKNIPLSVYHSLIETVRKGLPALHRYVGIRKKMLQLKEVHLYDMYVPLVPLVDMRMNYSEAEELVIESTTPLGDEYQEILRKGFKEQGWVDRYENKNKRSGGYSSGCYDSHPYILMNYRGLLRDVFTLAHEAGHSMHSYLSNQNQPYPYSRYPIFVAEVASTFNEEMLTHLLLQRTKKREERLFLINEKIEDIRATFFRQTMFAEFELKIHELVENNTPLTPTLLKDIYYQLNQDYFGPEAYIDSEIAIEWSRIPHFYYNFYVYQYATGLSASLYLAEKVLQADETAREQYLTFLKSGSSLFPTELLQLAGIDMLTPTPVEAVLRKFNTLLTELEILTKN